MKKRNSCNKGLFSGDVTVSSHVKHGRFYGKKHFFNPFAASFVLPNVLSCSEEKPLSCQMSSVVMKKKTLSSQMSSVVIKKNH